MLKTGKQSPRSFIRGGIFHIVSILLNIRFTLYYNYVISLLTGAIASCCSSSHKQWVLVLQLYKGIHILLFCLLLVMLNIRIYVGIDFYSRTLVHCFCCLVYVLCWILTKLASFMMMECLLIFSFWEGIREWFSALQPLNHFLKVVAHICNC